MAQVPYLLTKPHKQSVHKFTVYWTDGNRVVIKGINIEDAYRTMGWTENDVEKIAYIHHGDVDKYIWNLLSKKWVHKLAS